MSSQGEKKAYLEGNQKGYPVRAGGDFVYLRKAVFPVRVIIDGQPITMEAGEKRRIPRKEPGRQAFDSFEVDNTSDVAQSVTFVVGEGDYEKVIVSGELNVSAYVTSAGNGVSASLPEEITKTMGLINATEQDVVKGTIKQDSAVNTGAGFCFASFVYESEFYGMDNDNLYQLDTAAAAFKSTTALDWTGIVRDSSQNVHCAGVTAGGTVYFKHGNDLYKFSLYDLKVRLLLSGVFGNSTTNLGGFVHKGYFYFSDFLLVDRVVVYEIATNSYSVWSHANLKKTIYSRGDGKVYSASIGSSDEYEFTLAGDYVANNVGAGYSSQAGSLVSHDGSIALTSQNNFYRFVWAKSATYYGEVYIENTGDAATRKNILLDEPFEFAPILSKTRMTGRVVRVIMRMLLQTDGAGYLDSVVAFEWTDGYNTRKISGGTQTWQLRDIDDDISILLDSEFTLTRLPEL